MEVTKKKHWETKTPDQVSWTQEIPKTSLAFIHSFNLTKKSKIIDIGGGDSKLVDFLFDEGYENITVLDISEKTIEKAKLRLGAKATQVSWIVCDITEFKPTETYEIWHDRAAFHFLTTVDQIENYMQIAKESVSGYMTIGAFSENGPKKCSGLDIKQYNEKTLTDVIGNGFKKLNCIVEDHTTPFDTNQNFILCSFKRKTIKR